MPIAFTPGRTPLAGVGPGGATSVGVVSLPPSSVTPAITASSRAWSLVGGDIPDTPDAASTAWSIIETEANERSTITSEIISEGHLQALHIIDAASIVIGVDAAVCKGGRLRV